jgi:hypothetical protein
MVAAAVNTCCLYSVQLCVASFSETFTKMPWTSLHAFSVPKVMNLQAGRRVDQFRKLSKYKATVRTRILAVYYIDAFVGVAFPELVRAGGLLAVRISDQRWPVQDPHIGHKVVDYLMPPNRVSKGWDTWSSPKSGAIQVLLVNLDSRGLTTRFPVKMYLCPFTVDKYPINCRNY